MRKLNLQEKISLKALLVERGVPICELINTNNIETFNHYWSRIFARPISWWHTPKQWYKSERKRLKFAKE